MWDVCFRRLLLVKMSQKIMQIASFCTCKICSLCIEMLKAKTFVLPCNKLSPQKQLAVRHVSLQSGCKLRSSGELICFVGHFPTFQRHYDPSKRPPLSSKETVWNPRLLNLDVSDIMLRYSKWHIWSSVLFLKFLVLFRWYQYRNILGHDAV
jgi:hypothetical protein